jgi:hypothetical protein
MAVMSRKKRAVAQGWKAIDEQRNKENSQEKSDEKKITEEEHQERIKKLKELGLLK